MKIDPYNHKERYLNWKEKVSNGIPEIIHFVEQISPWDIEIEVMCENYLDYNTIIYELTKEFSNIIEKTETAIMKEDYVFPARKMIFE